MTIKLKEDRNVSFNLSTIHAINKALASCDTGQATKIKVIEYLSQIYDLRCINEWIKCRSEANRI